MRTDGEPSLQARAAAIGTVRLLEEPTLAGIAERLVAEAQAIAGAPAALYVGDLDGRSLRRVTGDGGLPEQLQSGQLIGPEIPAGHAGALAAGLPDGATVLPLALRGRALSALIFAAPPAGDLEAEGVEVSREARFRRESGSTSAPTSG